jgi:hypothetical protein
MVTGVQQGSLVRLVAIRQGSAKRALRAREAVPTAALGWPTALLAICAFYGGVVNADCYGTGITVRCVGDGPVDLVPQPRVRQLVHRAPGWAPGVADLKQKFPNVQV